KLNSLLSNKEEVLARIMKFRSLSEHALTTHENFEDSMKEFESLVREVESIHVAAKTFIERYGKIYPPPIFLRFAKHIIPLQQANPNQARPIRSTNHRRLLHFYTQPAPRRAHQRRQ